MIHLFTLVILVIALQILRYAGVKRLMYFVVGISFIPYIIYIPTPFLPSYRLFSLAMLVSALLRFKSFGRSMGTMPCKFFLLLVLLSYIATAVMDKRLPATNSLWKGAMYFVDTFLMLVAGYISLYKNEQMKHLNLFIIIVGLIVASYGIITGIIGKEPYGLLVSRLTDGDFDFTPLRSIERTRLTSFMYDPHMFGFFCSTMFSTILVLNRKSLMRCSYLIPITLVMLFLGVVFSGSRSSLVGLVIALAIYLILLGKIRILLKYVGCAVFALAIASTLPAAQEKIGMYKDLFSKDGGNTGGSSLRMRERQLELSLYFHKQSPIWGNGFNYFNEVLKPDERLIQKEGLQGAESYIFALLIEAGLVQICCITAFYLALFVYFLKNIRKHKDFALWGISVLIQFMIVITVTGAFGRWQYALPFIGLAMRAIVNEKKACHEAA